MTDQHTRDDEDQEGQVVAPPEDVPGYNSWPHPKPRLVAPTGRPTRRRFA